MTAAFTFHTDAAHGWLEVTLADVLDVGLFINSFSRYSYREPVGTGSTTIKLYLEEDRDASMFIAAYVEKHGNVPTLNDKHQRNSFVRNLPRLA